MEEAGIIVSILALLAEEDAARKEEKVRQAALATLQVALTSLKGHNSDSAPSTPSSSKGTGLNKFARRSVSLSRLDSNGGTGSNARNRRLSLAPETASKKDKKEKDKLKVADATPGRLSIKHSTSGEIKKHKTASIVLSKSTTASDIAVEEEKQSDRETVDSDATKEMKVPSSDFKPYLHAHSGADFISNPMKRKSTKLMLDVESGAALEKSPSLEISRSQSSENDSGKMEIKTLTLVERPVESAKVAESEAKDEPIYKTPGKFKGHQLSSGRQ